MDAVLTRTLAAFVAALLGGGIGAIIGGALGAADGGCRLRRCASAPRCWRPGTARAARPCWTGCAARRLGQAPRETGWWGEMAYRIERGLRLRDADIVQEKQRLQRVPAGHRGVAERRAAARPRRPDRVVQLDGGRTLRPRPRARPPPAHHQPRARAGLRDLHAARPVRRAGGLPGAQGPRHPDGAGAPLWRRHEARAVAGHHRARARRSDAARLRGQCLARDPHAADGAGGLRRDAGAAAAERGRAPARADA